MTRRSFLTVCCVLLVAASPLAQSEGKKASSDPITGTWTGELRRQGDDRGIAVTMQLKFDGKSDVTGTFTGLPNPGDVKKGTFDPKTGAVKLQMGKEGDATVLLVLEGTLDKDTIAGKFSGEESGEFKITKKQ
jgi:hypothetical protein